MQRKHYAIHWAAASAGLAALAVSIGSNVVHLRSEFGTYIDPAIAAVVVVTACVALALSCAFAAIREKHVVTGVLLLALFAAGSAFEISTTLDRTATARHDRLSAVWKADHEWSRLAKVEAEQSYLASRTCAQVGKDSVSEGPQCRAHRRESLIAKDLREKREVQLDRLGMSLSALIPGLDARKASLYQPVLLPIALFFAANFLLAFGVNGVRVKPEFDTCLTGRAADVDKARRFVEAYMSQNGAKPTAAAVIAQTGVKDFTARQVLKAA